MEIWATAKILAVFAAILIAARFKLSLGLALIGGGIALDFWAGRGAELAGDMMAAAADPALWLFVLNISLIIEFGVFMTEGGNSKLLTSAIHQWAGRHGRVFSIILLPAALGLVPMPGGAMFSAPLVGKAVDGRDLTPEWKSAANYWFRHIFEYWWPLYPVVIVTLSILPIPVWKFVLLQMPLTIASIAAGSLIILYPKRGELLSNVDERRTLGGVRALLMPLLVVFASVILLPQIIEIILPSMPAGIAKLLGMTIGLCIGLALIASHRRARPREQRGMVKRFFTRKNVNILITLSGVMIFKSLLETSGLIDAASEELAACRMPIVFVIAALPFLAGLVTGIGIGFAGTTFPLIAGLLAAGGDISIAAALPLAFGMGYAGMMLSPLHLCLLLTKDYFEARLLKVYLYLIPCVAIVGLASIMLHLLFMAMGL